MAQWAGKAVQGQSSPKATESLGPGGDGGGYLGISRLLKGQRTLEHQEDRAGLYTGKT